MRQVRITKLLHVIGGLLSIEWYFNKFGEDVSGGRKIAKTSTLLSLLLDCSCGRNYYRDSAPIAEVKR